MVGDKLEKKKALVISSLISRTSAQGVRYTNLFNSFQKEFDIIHLTYSTEKFTIDRSVNYSARLTIEKYLPKQFSKGIKYLLRKLFFPDEYIAGLFLFRKKIKQILSTNKIDLVFVCMTPFSFLSLGEYIKTLQPQVITIADLSDPFSANAEYYFNSKRKEKAIKIEKKYLAYFNLVVVLNDRIKSYYEKLTQTTVTTIEQGVNNIFSRTLPEKTYSEPFVLAYAGGFYRDFRDPANLLAALNMVTKNVVLTVYGGKLKTRQSLSDYPFVVSMKHINQNQLAKAYAEAHILVVIDNFYGIQVPGKTLECFSFNRPVLLIYNNTQSPTLDYLYKTKGVFAVENEVELIKDKIEFIMENYNKIDKKFDSHQFAWEALSTKYSNHFNYTND